MLLCSSRVEVEVIVKMSDHISCSFDQLMSMSNIRDRNSSSFSNLTHETKLQFLRQLLDKYIYQREDFKNHHKT